MNDPELVERLAAHRTVGRAPREELAWLASHGTVRHLAANDVLSHRGARVEGMFIVLAGRIAMFADRGAGLNKIVEWEAGDVAGLLPYSRLVAPPGDSVAQEDSTVLAVHGDHLRSMIRECHEVTSILVHTMIDRARSFTSSALHDEKMISLGKLSAGLAHELNNPVAAIERSAALLDDRLDDAERATRALGAARLTDAQLGGVDEIQKACLAARAHGVRSPVEQAEREEAIDGWLSTHGVAADLAGSLADTAVTEEALDALAAVVGGPALGEVLRWAAAGCSVRSLAWDIQESATRISGLVTAIKGFTHMDQAPVAEPVDLRQSLANTVAVLRSKARGKSVAVMIDVQPDLPPVRGFVGELNQIWANLIDNALDAVSERGRIDVIARRERGCVVVSVVDDGPGIPEGIRARIFEPFFTTKPMGQGTGLGLDIVRRLVRHNDGEIGVEIRPGRTEFHVTLRIAGEGGCAPGQP